MFPDFEWSDFRFPMNCKSSPIINKTCFKLDSIFRDKTVTLKKILQLWKVSVYWGKWSKLIAHTIPQKNKVIRVKTAIKELEKWLKGSLRHWPEMWARCRNPGQLGMGPGSWCCGWAWTCWSWWTSWGRTWSPRGRNGCRTLIGCSLQQLRALQVSI